MLLTQFDENKSAIINPGAGMDMVDNFPETVVSIFSAVSPTGVTEVLSSVKIPVSDVPVSAAHADPMLTNRNNAITINKIQEFLSFITFYPPFNENLIWLKGSLRFSVLKF